MESTSFRWPIYSYALIISDALRKPSSSFEYWEKFYLKSENLSFCRVAALETLETLEARQGPLHESIPLLYGTWSLEHSDKVSVRASAAAHRSHL